MKIGIIGPPQSGKTSVFKVLLGKRDLSASIGVFKPTDKRMEELTNIYSSKKVTYPELTFMDIGSISNFAKKELSQLVDVDLFICVVGSFFSPDPKKDFDSLLTDLILYDLEVAQNRTQKLKKDRVRANADKEIELLDKCACHLSEGNLLSSMALDKDDLKGLSGLFFLSAVPMILAVNCSDEAPESLNNKISPLKELAFSKNIPSINFFGKEEIDLLDIEEVEREKFLKELGNSYNFKSDISRLIFEKLNLITFFTAGDKETRGWLLRKGLPIIEAAGKIHSDIKRGFIRAEVMGYDDFVKYGSEHALKEKGLLKLEGKEYIVKDGDIINIRFSV